jgi:hypothetical protein
MPAVDAVRVLADRFGCSPRQARRYVDRAVGGRVPVVEPTVVFTVKVPAALADRVRVRARVSGETVSAVAVQALAEFLAPDRVRSGGR